MKGSVIRPLGNIQHRDKLPYFSAIQFCQNGSFEGVSVLDTPSRPILGRVLYSLFTAAQFLNALNNVLLSNFKAERFVYRFQSFFLRLNVSLDLRYHSRQLFLTFLAGFGVYVMRFSFSVSIGRRVSSLK